MDVGFFQRNNSKKFKTKLLLFFEIFLGLEGLPGDTGYDGLIGKFGEFGDRGEYGSFGDKGQRVSKKYVHIRD